MIPSFYTMMRVDVEVATLMWETVASGPKALILAVD